MATWYAGLLYLPVLSLTPLGFACLECLFGRWDPNVHARVLRKVDNWEQWLNDWLKSYHLVEVPRLMFATYASWVVREMVDTLGKVQDLRTILSELQGTQTQNEWGVGQVAALMAWLPLILQALVICHNLRPSQGRFLTPDIEIR